MSEITRPKTITSLDQVGALCAFDEPLPTVEIRAPHRFNILSLFGNPPQAPIERILGPHTRREFRSLVRSLRSGGHNISLLEGLMQGSGAESIGSLAALTGLDVEATNLAVRGLQLEGWVEVTCRDGVERAQFVPDSDHT